MKTVENLKQGDFHHLVPGELLNDLAPHFPLIEEMEATPQDPEWHAEGNVRTHTERVVAEALKRCTSQPLPVEQGLALVLGAALHDIGKALTTREETIDGRGRITSPYHAQKGRHYVATRLDALALEPKVGHQLLGLIGHHHAPGKLVRRSAGPSAYARLARAVEAELVYFLEVADIRGRICDDRNELLENLELFRLGAEEAGTWQTDFYAPWRRRLEAEVSDPGELQYVIGEAILDFENGHITSPEEALARTYSHRREHAELILLCGPAGSGKSTWATGRQDHGYEIINLDTIRVKMTGKRQNFSKEGQVLQEARERLRAVLRRNGKVIWDATSLRRDGRAALIGLARDYHAFTRIVCFQETLKTIKKQNRKRDHPIPDSVLEKQFHSWEWPEPWEAHRIEVANKSHFLGKRPTIRSWA
ncbi:MAG: AAA family ATPase [Verrucomicrobiota bacterium]